MSATDRRSDAVSGAAPQALDHFEKALFGFQTYTGDPFAAVDAAIAARPEFVMAHVLKAHLNIAGCEKLGFEKAAAIQRGAWALPTNERERMHWAAVTRFVNGDLDGAVEQLEDILVAHPRDVLALQMAHLYDFYRGDARNLRDRVARVLPAWDKGVPGHHAVLGMYAFGLEECGEYGRAEEAGGQAVALEPRDTWAHHAVAHVYEMQGRREEGLAWMRAREQHWAPDSFFAVHNWWHWALLHLDLDQPAEALALYDTRIRATRSTVALDMVDATAMLWRMTLRGIDVGQRWHELADAWAPFASDGFYAFNDAHATMAFVGAGRWDLAQDVIAAQRVRLVEAGSNTAMTRDVGLPLCQAVLAFGKSDFAATVRLLRPLRSIAHRFGGSHAQRDIIDLTLLEAARRAGQWGLLKALSAERLASRPATELAQRYQRLAQFGLAAQAEARAA